MFSLLMLSAGMGTILAPRFLDYHEEIIKADAIILFVGPDWEARKDETRRLLTDGYSTKLIIPLYHKYFLLGPNRGIPEVRTTVQDNSIARANKMRDYPRYFENTHVELLEAKQMMDALGLKSALCVSSAYHMRRVKVMADTVFKGNGYRICCAPVMAGGKEHKIWFLDREQVAWVTSEYFKLVWFWLYGSYAA
jgi:hypothetical protein